MKPVIIKAVFKLAHFLDIRAYVEKLAEACRAKPIDDTLFKRHTRHNDPFLVEVHKRLEPSLSTMLGRKVKPSYCLVSMYRDGGICPAHIDRPQCEYTIDLCVSQSHPWPIYIDGDAYILEEGQAVIYSGTKSLHYRHEMKPGNSCMMVFFHFVDEDFEGSLD